MRHFITNAATLVAHNNHSRRRQISHIYIFAAKECATHFNVLGGLRQHLWQVAVDYTHASDGTHRRLNYFGIKAVDGVGRCQDGVHAHPVGGAHYGAEVAGVLHTVERHCDATAQGVRVEICGLRLTIHSDDVGSEHHRRHLTQLATVAHFGHNAAGHRMRFEPLLSGKQVHQVEMLYGIEHALGALGHEAAGALATLRRG